MAQPARRLPDGTRSSPLQTQRARRGAGVVLVVDDTSDTLDIYSLYLTGRGFKVPTARDAFGGIDAARRHQPDVIVMDLSMPGLDGIAATRLLKADPRTAHIPVLILTAYPFQAVEGGALEAGADECVTKPCLPADLEQHVQRLLVRTRSGRSSRGGASTGQRSRR